MTISTKIRNFTIRPATEKDAPVILSLIKGLAEYEKLSHEVFATEKLLRDTLFGAHPVAEVILGDFEGEPVSLHCSSIIIQRFLGYLASTSRICSSSLRCAGKASGRSCSRT